MNQHNGFHLSSPQGQDGKGKVVMCSETHLFSGPLPPPEVFARYEHILAGSADRILKMAEIQSSHRQSLEKKVIGGEQFRANTGLVFGFIIGMTIISGGLFMIYLEKEWQGFIVLVGGVSALVGTFVYGKKQKKDDLHQKDEELRNHAKGLEEKVSKDHAVIDGETVR